MKEDIENVVVTNSYEKEMLAEFSSYAPIQYSVYFSKDDGRATLICQAEDRRTFQTFDSLQEIIEYITINRITVLIGNVYHSYKDWKKVCIEQ